MKIMKMKLLEMKKDVDMVYEMRVNGRDYEDVVGDKKPQQWITIFVDNAWKNVLDRAPSDMGRTRLPWV